jgi:creatinine amidohydrolase/Fe(II)-dependent formamide hydrolase-like protein
VGRPEATGVYGDATLATREKGGRILAAIVPALVAAAEYLRTAPIDWNATSSRPARP